MKILIFSEYFYPHWTGIAKACCVLANQLAEEGREVTVVTTRFDKSLKPKETYRNISIIRAPGLFALSRTYLSPQTIVEALLQTSSHDAVIINSPHSLILPLSIVSKLARKRLLIFHQGDLILPLQTGMRLINRLIEMTFDALTIASFALADRVSTYTKDYARHSRVMKYFLNKFFAYIPPIALSGAKSNVQFNEKMVRLKNKYALIGFAGRFVEEKGFDILFQALPQVLEEFPYAKFIFAGQTKIDYEPFFEKNKILINSVRNHVVFLGLLSEADLAQFYQNLDIFVISSRSDCFPLTQIEAALSGIPCIVTDIPGARMLVKTTGFGEIVKPKDPESLAKGIIRIIQNKKKYSGKKHKVIKFLKSYEIFELD